MSDPEIERVISQVWKHESARVIAALARLLRNVHLAEEFAQDALVAALEQWPAVGLPDRPGAWLMTTAKNRALNAIRHRGVVEDKLDAVGHAFEAELSLEAVEAALEAGMDQDIADDVLRLVFAACHPVLARETQVALTLRMLGGLSTDEIARAFLVSESTIAQRIVRGKRALAEANVPFEVPRGAELGERLSAVLEVVYLIFNEGYLASAGDDVMRPALCHEALRLGQLLSELAPNEPEVLGLQALMELTASRAEARTDEHGEPILLLEQDRLRWDASNIQRGLAALAHAESLGQRPGPYQLQAALAACHARAPSADATDWRSIAELYSELAQRQPSPVVELNRAIAISRADGPLAGLSLLDALAALPAMARYHLLPSARADMLERLGRFREARAEFERAAELTDNARQRERLRRRAQLCESKAHS
ncbi:MAG: sigma-70 family RNA polymerase sigma factor [Myxococcales bacterium]